MVLEDGVTVGKVASDTLVKAKHAKHAECLGQTLLAALSLLLERLVADRLLQGAGAISIDNVSTKSRVAMATATATATATHGGHLELGGVLLDLLLGSGVLGSSRVGSSGRGSHVDCGYGGWYVVGGETRDARGVATRVRGISKLSLAANPHSEQCAADERAASDLTGWPSRSCGAVLCKLD